MSFPVVDVSLQLAGGAQSTEGRHQAVVTQGAFDVVSGPVDTPDGHAHPAQAALLHVAGNAAAHARVAPQSKAADFTVLAAIAQAGLEVRGLESARLVDHNHDQDNSDGWRVDGW